MIDLYRIRNLKLEIMKNKQRLEVLETLLMPRAIRYDIEKVQHEPVDNLADLTIKIVELREKIQKQQGEMLTAMETMTNTFDGLQNRRERDTMYCRYVGCLKQSETAEYLGLTERHVQRLEESAKKNLRVV